jgi:hypothetical protein
MVGKREKRKTEQLRVVYREFGKEVIRGGAKVVLNCVAMVRVSVDLQFSQRRHRTTDIPAR